VTSVSHGVLASPIQANLTQVNILSLQVDMWSAGVVLFILLGGYPPFWNESEPALFDQIRKGAFSFDDPAWKVVSDR
jgi:serine/threonine protein kinase